MKLEPPELMDFLKDRVRVNFTRKTLDRPCIEWVGGEPCGRNGKYRRVWYKGKRYRVHRLVWLLSGREINITEHLDHLCENTVCVALSHLEATTPKENLARRFFRVGSKEEETMVIDATLDTVWVGRDQEYRIDEMEMDHAFHAMRFWLDAAERNFNEPINQRQMPERFRHGNPITWALWAPVYKALKARAFEMGISAVEVDELEDRYHFQAVRSSVFLTDTAEWVRDNVLTQIEAAKLVTKTSKDCSPSSIDFHMIPVKLFSGKGAGKAYLRSDIVEFAAWWFVNKNKRGLRYADVA